MGRGADMGYVQRVRDARREAKKADDALQASDQWRKDSPPWVEDDTFLDLNAKAGDAANRRTRTILGRDK